MRKLEDNFTTFHSISFGKESELKNFLSFFDFDGEYTIKDLDGDIIKVKAYVRDYDKVEARAKYKNEFGEICELDIDVVLIVDNDFVFAYGDRTYKNTERLAKLLVTMLTAVDFEDVGDFFAPISEYPVTITIQRKENSI